MYICFCFWIDSHDFRLVISPPITLRKHLSTLLWIQVRNLIKSTHPQSFKDCIHKCCIRFFRFTQNKHQQQTNQQTTKPTKPNQANTETHQASTATIYSHIFASLKSRLFGLLPRGVWILRFVNPPPEVQQLKTLKTGWYAKRKVADRLPFVHHFLTEKELNFEGFHEVWLELEGGSQGKLY